ncbi:MAG: hypothetical protein AAFN41_09440, partial [Planctomycetota bacterium]
MASPRAHTLSQLAAAGRWWDVAAASTGGFNDPDALMLAAHAWTKLGLPTLATATIDRLIAAFPAGRENPRVASLTDQITAAPRDIIDHAILTERVEHAVATLKARDIDLSAALRDWAQANSGSETLVANDGNVVRRHADETLQLIGDHRGASRALIAQHGEALATSRAPILIEGFDPPWLALDVQVRTAGTGYAPGIRIVQEDPVEFLDGVSLINTERFATLVEDERLQFFVGLGAGKQLLESMLAEPGVAHEGPAVPLATLRTRTTPAIAEVFRHAKQRASAEHRAALDVIGERATSERASEHIGAIAGGTPRVALIAGRFTTVLRPMIEDLAHAFERAGCTTHIVTEPSDHRMLTAHAYTRAFSEFDPDLIVCANYTREDMNRLVGEPAMPSAVPWVTWVQDAMPHLLQPDAGSAVTPIDLAVGQVTSAMQERFGFPSDRSIVAPMVASETKFSPDAIDQSLVPVFACEVAAFTNHCETPNAMRSRLIDEVSDSSNAAALVERIADRAIALAAEPIERVIAPVRCAAIIEDVAADLDQAARNNLYENVAMRLYDRCRRHEALGWAQRACGDNGWRLAIYGEGWDRHPTLAPHARGRVAHGAELCSAYNAARVTLDTSTLSGFHQRITECALSGGIPAVLLTGLACTVARAAMKKQLLDEHRADGIPVAHQPGSLAFPVFRHAEAMRFARFGSIVNGRSYPYAICD